MNPRCSQYWLYHFIASRHKVHLRVKMVNYKIYRVQFETRLGTKRVYIGHTKVICLRKNWAEKKPPAFMGCRNPKDLDYVIIEENIATKAQALALEAYYAARYIVAEPDLCRGGPWSNPTLSDCQKDELQAASRCCSLFALSQLAESNKRGSLYRHLKDLVFVKPEDATPVEKIVRGAVVRKRKSNGRSGPCGCRYRKKAVQNGVVKRPSAHFTRLKRGVDYRARRDSEQERRPVRRFGDKKRKEQSLLGCLHTD